MDTFAIGQTVGNPQNGDSGQVQDIWWHGSLLVQFLTVWVERSGTTYEWNSRYVIDASTPHFPGSDAGCFPEAHPRYIIVTIPAMDNHGDHPTHNKITVKLNKCCVVCGAERGEVTRDVVSFDGSCRLYGVDTWRDGCNHFRGYSQHRVEAFLNGLNPGYRYQADYDVRASEATAGEDEPRSPAGGGSPEAETLGDEYCAWSDQVNQGWTEAEIIAALRKELTQLWDINRDLRDELYELKQAGVPKLVLDFVAMRMQIRQMEARAR